MRIGFLVYDSRSGSTLLARTLMQERSDVAVTQEIGFEHLFGAAAATNGRLTRPTAQDALRRDYLRNLGASKHELGRLLADMGETFHISDLLAALLRLHRARTAGGPATAPEWTLIKYGRHVLCWDAIQACLGPQTPLLHVVRDPRAVISSKLATPRPYFPFETLAWGGSLVAAIRWRAFCRAFRRAKDNGALACEIRYEELVADPAAAVAWVATSLGWPNGNRDAEPGSEYRVPAAEQLIHQRAHRAPVDSRTTAWRDELPEQDRRRIEAVLLEEMTDRGYESDVPWNSFRRWRTLACATPTTAWRIARHYARHAWLKCGGSFKPRAA